MNVLVIGIVGGTGSGKTSLAHKIKGEFIEDVSILSQDFYYKKSDHLSILERQKLNYDAPEAFDTDMLINDIKKLKNGELINHPLYDYKEHNRSDKLVELNPTKIIIVEGILIFYDKRLRDILDIKIYIDTDDDIRVLRRLIRDLKERKRTIDSIVNQYIETTKPMHETYVKPSKKYADIVVKNILDNDIIFDIIINKIKVFINT